MIQALQNSILFDKLVLPKAFLYISGIYSNNNLIIVYQSEILKYEVNQVKIALLSTMPINLLPLKKAYFFNDFFVLEQLENTS